MSVFESGKVLLKLVNKAVLIDSGTSPGQVGRLIILGSLVVVFTLGFDCLIHETTVVQQVLLFKAFSSGLFVLVFGEDAFLYSFMILLVRNK